MKIAELGERLTDLNDQSAAILATADGEKRSLTVEERNKIKELRAEFDSVKDEIETREAVEAQAEVLSTPRPRVTSPEPPCNDPVSAMTLGTAADTARHDVRVLGRPGERGNHGWRSFGEFAQGVKLAASPGGDRFVDNRLTSHLAPTTVGSEGVGADGGFAVPPDFRATITSTIEGEESLLALTDQLVTSSNHIEVPLDETTPWQTTGGIQAFWEGENELATQSKPALERNTVRLNKLMVLVPVTDELMEDAPALSTYLNRKAPEKMLFKINLALIQGTGVGMPLGILNSPATISVAKTGSQVADTVVAQNIIDMYSAMYAPSRSNAVWLMNQSVEKWILSMSQPGRDETSAFIDGYGNATLYMPPGGLSAAPFGTLMGKRVIPTQACDEVGDVGDIIFADLSQYMSAQKVGGIRAETSIHLWFDYDTTAFRFIFRVGGIPWWQTAASARDGSATYSPFVTLAERT